MTGVRVKWTRPMKYISYYGTVNNVDSDVSALVYELPFLGRGLRDRINGLLDAQHGWTTEKNGLHYYKPWAERSKALEQNGNDFGTEMCINRIMVDHTYFDVSNGHGVWFGPNPATHANDRKQFKLQSRFPIQITDFPLSDPGTISDRMALEAQGTSAIARCRPLSAHQALMQDLIETYKDGLPRIPGKLSYQDLKAAHKAAHQTGADEYLNYEFGWKPLISDLRSISNSIITAHKKLEQLKRDNGKEVRRRYSFPQETESHSWNRGLLWTPDLVATREGDYVGTAIRDEWFSGCFKYFLPLGDDIFDRLRDSEQKAHLFLGLDLRPSTIYQATPWTWMADWFSNLGDIFSNTDMIIDNVSMKYGYIMSHYLLEMKYVINGAYNYPHNTRFNNFGVTRIYEQKSRLQATPFGFGVDTGALTGFQESILAALSLSRMGRPWNAKL